MEPVHEHGVALVELAPPGARQIEAKVDARIEIQHDPARARLPMLWILVVVEQVAQHHQSNWGGTTPLVADPPRPCHCPDVPQAPKYRALWSIYYDLGFPEDAREKPSIGTQR